LKALSGIRQTFKTKQPVIIYSASGTGAWEGTLVNTLFPADHVLMYETGQFATLWKKLADRLGFKTEFLGLSGIKEWRYGVDAAKIEERVKSDSNHQTKRSAWCVTKPRLALFLIGLLYAKQSMQPDIRHC